MTLIIIKFLHFLAIIFSGGVLVGGGVIQSVYTKANQIPDLNVAKILKLLGYLGLIFSYGISWYLGQKLYKNNTSNKTFISISFIFLISSYIISTVTFYFFSGWKIEEDNILRYMNTYFFEFLGYNLFYLLILFIIIKTSNNLKLNSIIKTKY